MRAFPITIALLLLAAPAAAQESAEAPAQLDRGSYETRLSGLGHQVREVGSEIAASHRRLALLDESMRGRSYGHARVSLLDEAGSMYRLVGATLALDGELVYRAVDPEGVELAEHVLFDSALPPGPHTLTVRLDYQGESHGLFRYVEGYRFTVRASHTFTATRDGAVEVEVSGLPSPLTEAYGQRLRVGFHETRTER